MRYFLPITLLVLFAAEFTVFAQGDIVPQAGLVLLRNGNILNGRIIRAGDFYIVSIGSGSEIRLPVQDVDAICRDLDDAYAIKLATMSGRGAKPHLDLAEWCLRQQMIAKATEQLELAVQEEPDHPRISGLQYRLKMTTEKPKEAKPVPDQSLTVTAEHLDHWERDLPKGTVDKFANVAQPILLNRCATNGCHGGQSGGAYQLIRPPVGQLIQRRVTQRNLFATMKYVDKSNPTESPLLQMPLKAHGGLSAAVFEKNSRIQVEQLALWVEQATAFSSPTVVPSIAPAVAHLSQSHDPNKPIDGEVKQTAAKIPLTAPGDKSGDPKGTSNSPAGFRPRDVFDPEIFNRKVHGSKDAGK